VIIDSHAHYCHRRFENQFHYLTAENGAYASFEGTREQMFREFAARGILCSVEPGIDLASNGVILEAARVHPGRIFPAVGVHPTRAIGERWRDRRMLSGCALNPEVVAIGETGLDYHFPRRQQHRLKQKLWFFWQLRLAHKHGLPVILHIRDAHEDALRILRRCRKILHGGVVHCFTGNARQAAQYTALGLHLGIGGSLLQDKDYMRGLPDAVRQTPLDRLLVETDAPYVHPDCKPHVTGKLLRKTRNSSLILPRVIDAIADLKGISPEAVETATTENAIRLFRLEGKLPPQS